MTDSKAQKLIAFIQERNLKIRIGTNLILSEWKNWITIPVKGYLDYGEEPVSIKEIKELDINLFVEKIIGIKIPAKKFDYSNDLVLFLHVEGFSYIIKEKYIKVNLG